jgi:hypothetical protein
VVAAGQGQKTFVIRPLQVLSPASLRAMESLGNPGAWSTTFQLTVVSGG